MLSHEWNEDRGLHPLSATLSTAKLYQGQSNDGGVVEIAVSSASVRVVAVDLFVLPDIVDPVWQRELGFLRHLTVAIVEIEG